MAIINSMGTNETYVGAYRNKTEQRGVKAAQKARLENPEVKKYQDLAGEGATVTISTESQEFMAGVAERKAAQQAERDKLMEQYSSNPFANSGNCMTLVNLETGEKVNPEPSQWQVFNDSLRKSGYYDNMSEEEIKKTEDMLKSITYRVDSIHDLTDFDRHLSDLSHEAAKLEFLSSISALNYFADTYLSGDARDSFKSLIKDYEEYNSASVAKHENWSDLYADSMKNIGAPNATGVKEAVRQSQERTKASQEIGRVTHTEEDEAKLYQDYQALFNKLASGEGNINSIFDDLKNTLIGYASGGSKNSAVSELLQSQNANSFNNILHYWSQLLKS